MCTALTASSNHLGEAGAPANEIEITPEMIEAGMIEYNRRWCGLADADDDVAREMVRAAYLAMRRLLPSPGYQWL